MIPRYVDTCKDFMITDENGVDWWYDDMYHILYVADDVEMQSMQRVYSFGEAICWLMDNDFLPEEARHDR